MVSRNAWIVFMVIVALLAVLVFELVWSAQTRKAERCAERPSLSWCQ